MTDRPQSIARLRELAPGATINTYQISEFLCEVHEAMSDIIHVCENASAFTQPFLQIKARLESVMESPHLEALESRAPAPVVAEVTEVMVERACKTLHGADWWASIEGFERETMGEEMRAALIAALGQGAAQAKEAK